MKKARKALAVAGGAVAAALLISGCTPDANGGGSTEPVSGDEFEAAMSTPTDLTFWTWVPDIEDEVALFEAAYPAMNVTVENVGQGLEHYQRVRTAIQSSDGAPDVIQVEYQYIPSFTLGNSLLDLTPYGADEIADDYVGWVWNQVSTDAGVWAIPQDVGPMGNLYRSDILAEAGVTEAPVTYADYAVAAEQVRTTGSYISNFPTNDPAQVIGLLWQAGVKPFGFDGDETVMINVNSEEAKEVMAYWQDLIERDLVSTDADFNDAFYQGFASDKYAGWLTAAWGPIFLQGTAADTAGNWTAAPLPQWNEGDNVSGNWGGSSNAVLASTENPIAAAELAKFINNDEESTKLFATQQFLFPAANSVLQDPEFTDGEVEFFGGQQVNALFAEISDTVDTDFDWLPFTDYAYSQFNEIVGTAIGDGGDLGAAMDQWQDTLVSYAEQQGFTVE